MIPLWMKNNYFNIIERLKGIVMSKSKEVPIWEKVTLTVEEAAALFRIGEGKLRKLANENYTADFILWNGIRPQFKRKLFEEFINKLNSI